MKLALAALVLLSACKRAPQEPPPAVVATQDVVAGVAMIDYVATDAKFTCRVPGEWGVRSDKHLDPSKGVVLTDGRSTHISITKYPDLDPQYTDARAYAETFWQLEPKGKQPDIAREKIGDMAALRLHYERMPYPKRSRNDRAERIDSILIPVKGGFYELRHTAPADGYQKTLPVFEAVARSFRPQS